MVKVNPILFSPDIVQSIFDGSKINSVIEEDETPIAYFDEPTEESTAEGGDKNEAYTV